MSLSANAPSIDDRYRLVVRKRLMLALLIIAAIVASLVLDSTLGPSGLSLGELWQTLLHPASVNAGTRVIVWDIRLPYALMALLVGMALGLAGAEMQTILNNPLASPFTLGVSSAAAFGAALAIVLGIGIPGVPAAWFIPANAFAFALLSALLLDGITRWTRVATSGVVLFGIALDLNYQFHVMDLIARETRARNIVTVVVVHDINIALRHSEHVLMLKEGKLVASGAPEAVITAESLAEVYNVRGRVERCSQGRAQVVLDGVIGV